MGGDGRKEKRARSIYNIKTTKKLLRIVAPHFVAGIEINGRCAPILRYMTGWTEKKIREYCKKKSWQVLALRRMHE